MRTSRIGTVVSRHQCGVSRLRSQPIDPCRTVSAFAHGPSRVSMDSQLCKHSGTLTISFFVCRESGIVSLSVSEAPCGHCRQFMKEFRGAETLKIDIMPRDVQTDLNGLLPFSFGPKELGK